MHIRPAHLLLIMLILIFSPSIHTWVIQGEAAWYRPYIIWSLVIFYSYFIQRNNRGDNL